MCMYIPLRNVVWLFDSAWDCFARCIADARIYLSSLKKGLLNIFVMLGSLEKYDDDHSPT